MFEQLQGVKERFDELSSMLSDPEIATDPARFRPLLREHGRLQSIIRVYDQYTRAQDAAASGKRMMEEDDDPEIRALAKEEVIEQEEAAASLAEELMGLLVPPDPLDEKDIYLEIRAGTGGEEAALFVADMLRMYSRYAMQRGWTVEIVSENATDHGGYREVVALIHGQDVYSRLKYESGTHRVQRVPETETKGRIHTSAVTVAIMPEADDVDIDIDDKDLRIDTYRASGSGGQHVNKTSSAIRITHEPTGVVVTCQDERGQHSNKAAAMKMLRAQLFDMQLTAQRRSQAAERRDQVGSGDRSERIRTYNFPQSRVTDHRIDLTLYKLDTILNGAVDEVINPLLTHHRALALKAQEITGV